MVKLPPDRILDGVNWLDISFEVQFAHAKTPDFSSQHTHTHGKKNQDPGFWEDSLSQQAKRSAVGFPFPKFQKYLGRKPST